MAGLTKEETAALRTKYIG